MLPKGGTNVNKARINIKLYAAN